MGSSYSKGTPTILQGYIPEKNIIVVSKDKGQVAMSTKQTTDQPSEAAVEQENKFELMDEVIDDQEHKSEVTDASIDDPDFIKTVSNTMYSTWPIRNYMKLDFNVNAYHGGCASLVFVSCYYGAELTWEPFQADNGRHNNVELLLLRSGFDCHHAQMKSICHVSEGYFEQVNQIYVDEEGSYVPDSLFGTNHIMLLTNDSHYGNLRNGVFLEKVLDDETPFLLPLNVKNTSDNGVSMVLLSDCHGSAFVSSVYLIQSGSGTKDNYFQSKLISGEDKFKFGKTEDGTLTLDAKAGCQIGLFHNRDNLLPESKRSHVFVGQVQAVEGTNATKLMEVDGHSTVVILCSNSNGTEDSTVATIYHVAVQDEKVAVAKEISGCHGNSYEKADLWTFEIKKHSLLITGPTGPCRYAVLSNIKASKRDLLSSIQQNGCLATGDDTKTSGNVKVTLNDVTGSVNKLSDVCIMKNHKIVATISSKDLKKTGNMYEFSYKWLEQDQDVGYHMIRVYSVQKHRLSDKDIFMELSGSPHGLIRQKLGVVYALNCTGPAYQALDDIVYTSNHKQFANFDSKVLQGMRYTTKGRKKRQCRLSASMMKTHDGFLYHSALFAMGEKEHDNDIIFKVKDIANGSYKLRLHLINMPKIMEFNGRSIAQQIREEIEKGSKPRDLKGRTGYCVEIDVTVTDGGFTITTKSTDVYNHGEYIAAFALLESSFQRPSISSTQIKSDQEERQKLADTILPLNTNATRKHMAIVGWSPNLIMNPSGETGDMKYWNTSGSFKIVDGDGGYGAETCFRTSFMWCTKYQEVNLLDHFTADYIDSSPDIQVVEMYREGCNGGGFYEMTAQLLTEDGKVIKEYCTGEIGTINNEQQWIEASTVFKDYGSGARIVSLSSKGKDDKYWAGDYGPWMSAAAVRVKRETVSAEGDKFADIEGDDSDNKSKTDKLVTRVLSENQELHKEIIDMEKIPTDENFERQTQISVDPSKSRHLKKHVKHKKREIRVFVSSTFRDFTREREEIIKTAFREINRMCADRGVFFTYVDLRWGITSEQTNHGQTIHICLQEIDRCRPYFICLMGDRFGWCQKSGTKDELLDVSYDYAIENNPKLQWIDNLRYDTSVTQLEISHGVLNDPEAAKNRAFFYMRDTPSPDNYTEKEYTRLISESEYHHEKQEHLKGLIEQHNLNLKRFKTHTEVAELIAKDLEHCVDEDFPKGTELTKLEILREAHAAFASVRCRVYIGRQDYFTQIDSQRADQINKPFVLLGESGCGKSALVANWAKRVEDREPDTFMYIHFIGSSADSSHYIKMIRRMFEEMKEYYGFDLQIPTSDTLLIAEVSKWLRMAGARTKVVIVFDAINQLDDGSGEQIGQEHDLQWIPSELPPNVFMLLSTLPGQAMTACVEAGWPTMKVSPLEDSQKNQIITDYLEGIYGKTLNQEQKDKLVNAKQTSNPLYLKSLLDEIRMYGSFRTLTDKINDYLSAETPGDLFAKILERLELDFEGGQHARKSLVRDATVALWCSNRGMSEAELTELLDVPSAVWSPFYLSLYENLVNRNGLLNFFHDHLRQAVEKKYLSTAEDKRQGYLTLADYFSGKETSMRTVEELPYLLTKAGELERLKVTVSDLDVFYRLSDNEDGIFELIKAWKTLGDFSLSETAYMSAVAKVPRNTIVENVSYYSKLFSHLGNFFLTLGLMEAAKDIYLTLIKHLEQMYGESHGTVVYDAWGQSWTYRCKHPEAIKSLQDLGTVYLKMGDLDKAVSVYNDAINRQNRIRTTTQKIQLCEGLLGLATVYIEKADMTEAKILMTRALELALNVLGRKHHFVVAIFTRLGQLSYKQGRVDEALGYYLQDLKVMRSEVGTNHPRAAIVLNEIGLVLDDKNDVTAGEMYEAALRIILETYGKNYLGTGSIRYNLGAFYFGTNHFAKAKYQFTESYKIHQSFLGDDHPATKEVKVALSTLSDI